MSRIPRKPNVELTRRQLLGSAALLGAGALLPRWAWASAGLRGASQRSESRLYVFNLSHIDTSSHDLIFVAGKRREKLKATTPALLRKARKAHPILAYVPDAHLTHHVTLEMPADAVQLCYVQRVQRGRNDGRWDMAMQMYHHPTSALLHAHRRRKRRGLTAVPHKWRQYALSHPTRLALNDPIGEEVLQDTNSHAVALVAGYPELAAGEPNSAAHIQTNIISTQPATFVLGQALSAQGAATPDGGWATQTPLINDATGQPYLNSQGQIQYLPIWSEQTGQYAAQAISPSLDVAKDDTSLGTNITDIDPTTLVTNDPDAPTAGAIWTLHDGQSTVDQSSNGLLGEGEVEFQLTNQSPGHGFSLSVEEVGVDDFGNITITLEAKNWYVRYLGLFVRYLDGNNQPIKLSAIQQEIPNYFQTWTQAFNGTYDAYLDMLHPQWTVIGIPVRTAELKRKIPVPASAASVQILSGGLGSGALRYPDTVAQGIAMTVIFNLAVPSLLLSLMAAAGYGHVTESLQDSETLRECLEEGLEFFSWAGLNYEENGAFQELAVDIGKMLLGSGAAKIDALIAESIAEGEEIQAVEDAMPIVGAFLSAIWAVGLIVDLVETSAQTASSPQTYVDTISLTHDIQVTIKHDPDDPAGFPATATKYSVTAVFDGGTPRTILADMPGTTVTEPIVVTFDDVPAGGKAIVHVGFYSSTNFLVGQGDTGTFDNTASEAVIALAITIDEVLVPLVATTRYSHKEVTALDNAGNHVWHGTTTAPTTVTPEGQSDTINGNIASWTGITVSTVNAAVGYAWQGYNSAVNECATGAGGQLHQFANISATQDPQSKYLFSGCGFTGATRIVYDLLGKLDRNFYLDTTNGGNYIRQIRLGSPASYDGPASNRAFGKLQFPSDAMLLHPLGKIISVNTALSKLEVLDLPTSATTDAQAPLSQVRSGVGTREGLMSGPVLAVVSPQGTILVLEAANNRIQAFDIGGNPVPYFANNAYFVPLLDAPLGGAYLDLAIEYSGYLYVLSYAGPSGGYTYRLDIYTPEGSWLSRTTGVNAAKLAVNYWRDLFTLNYEVLRLPGGAFPNRTEPSVSHWIPSTPNG